MHRPLVVAPNNLHVSFVPLSSYLRRSKVVIPNSFDRILSTREHLKYPVPDSGHTGEGHATSTPLNLRLEKVSGESYFSI